MFFLLNIFLFNVRLNGFKGFVSGFKWVFDGFWGTSNGS